MMYDIYQVQVRVAECLGFTRAHLIAENREPAISYVRHVAMYVVREVTKKGFLRLALAFERHHTTVIHGCQKIDWLMERDEKTRKLVTRLLEEIKGVVAAGAADSGRAEESLERAFTGDGGPPVVDELPVT